MKKVLFLGHSGLSGGAEYCLDTFLRFLDSERIMPWCFFATDGPLAEAAKKRGILSQVITFSWWMLYTPSLWEWKNRLKIPFRILWLMYFLRREKIELVYTNTPCLFEGALAAWLTGIPHVYHIHEVLRDENMRPRWFSLNFLMKFVCRRSSRIIFVSEAAKEVACALLPESWKGEFQKKSRVVWNASRFSSRDWEGMNRENSRQRWEIPSDKIVILWIGRFSRRKNPKMFLEAITKMRHKSQVMCLFVGDGPLIGEVQEIIKNENLSEICRILPFQEDIRSLIVTGDLAVLTSTEESFGLVLVEAGIYGIPLVATRVEGPSYIIKDGVTGFLVDVNDAETFAEKLDWMIEFPSARQEMGEKTRQRILTLFDPVKNASEIMNILDEIHS
ncbi:MAG: glycosyltransferase [Planctomycetia bacterium]|nr:glycosyltransferase [Planctomycetia bacterium]